MYCEVGKLRIGILTDDDDDDDDDRGSIFIDVLFVVHREASSGLNHHGTWLETSSRDERDLISLFAKQPCNDSFCMMNRGGGGGGGIPVITHSCQEIVVM